MPYQKWWSRWRVNSNLARTSFQINLYRTQLQGDEKLKIPLPSLAKDLIAAIERSATMCSICPMFFMNFQLDAISESRVFLFWVRDVGETFMGPRGLKAPPLLLYPLEYTVYFNNPHFYVFHNVFTVLSSWSCTFQSPEGLLRSKSEQLTITKQHNTITIIGISPLNLPRLKERCGLQAQVCWRNCGLRHACLLLLSSETKPCNRIPVVRMDAAKVANARYWVEHDCSQFEANWRWK